MNKVINCWGVICSQCEYCPNDCAGCSAIEGKVFWLQYTGMDIYGIYDC